MLTVCVYAAIVLSRPWTDDSEKEGKAEKRRREMAAAATRNPREEKLGNLMKC
jgi:hypothetical protein